MSRVSGYIVILSDSRYFSLRFCLHKTFSEPVSEFDYSRNIPLICFIMNHSGLITHIGLGSRGMSAGTDLRKLNIEDIYELKSPVLAIEIANLSAPKVKYNISFKVKHGGLLTRVSFEEFLKYFLEKAPDVVPILGKYTEERSRRIDKLSQPAKRSLAVQKEALLTALNIAGIDRDNIRGWDYDEKLGPTSFLDGISHVTLREDSMIVNDLSNFPGFDLIKSTKYSSSVFENDQTRLTVLLANRQPLEELLGTDLIYFNETLRCFIMVQYKVMEKENDVFKFRLPNKQLSEEIFRMDSIFQLIENKKDNEQYIEGYRISENPFFVKICPRLEFDPDNIGLSSGMYVPLDYIKRLQNDKSIEGKCGGKAITFENIGRYLDNTEFKVIIEGGWIGTNPSQSSKIRDIIKDILENGKAAVIALDKDIRISKHPVKRSSRRF